MFDGVYDLTRLDETEIAELGIGRKFQKPTVFESQTVDDNLELALKVGPSRPRHAVVAGKRRQNAERIDEPVGDHPPDGGARPPGRQPVARPEAMARDRHAAGAGTEALLVDEPVAGMTDVETHQTAELLKEINREHTVVVVEHDMAFVRDLGVKVTCLHEGSVLAEGTIDQVSANERVVEVYLGR